LVKSGRGFFEKASRMFRKGGANERFPFKSCQGGCYSRKEAVGAKGFLGKAIKNLSFGAVLGRHQDLAKNEEKVRSGKLMHSKRQITCFGRRVMISVVNQKPRNARGERGKFFWRNSSPGINQRLVKKKKENLACSGSWVAS